jgi:hypothetical protein
LTRTDERSVTGIQGEFPAGSVSGLNIQNMAAGMIINAKGIISRTSAEMPVR